MKREMTNMIPRSVSNPFGFVRPAMLPFAILAMFVANCAYSAQQPVQPTFKSAAEASQNLFQAVQANNEAAITKILGGPTDLTSSGDAVQDKLDRELFVQKYQQMHRVGSEADGSMTLYVGAENWPFPIPLTQKNGVWHFDSDAGRKEVLLRRIGENELTAIDICHQLVAGEKQFLANGKAAIQANNPLASLVAAAASGSTSGQPVLIQGYYFRVAAKHPNADFAFIAYPAEYRLSGVKTFIVTDKNVVNEKDLGANTTAQASTMPADYRGGWAANNEK
jgi:Protein of unknown function (DUF2950)